MKHCVSGLRSGTRATKTKISQLGLLALALALPTSVGAMWCYPSGSDVSGNGAPDFCIGAHDLGTGSTEFTLFSSVGGYLGFGVGETAGEVMGPADVMVAYPDATATQTNGVVIASFLTQGAGLLTVNPTMVWTATALNTTIPQPTWASFAVSVIRPNAATGVSGVALNIASTTNFIFAWCSVPVSNSNGTLGLTYHRNNHTSVVAIINANSASSADSGSSLIALPSSISITMIVYIHVILVSIAFTLMPSAGMFVAMFLRQRLGTKWIAVHLGLMIGGVALFAILGVVVMILFKPGKMFSSVHQYGGIVVLVLMFVQFALGFVAKSSVDGSSALIAQAHKYFGLFFSFIIIPAQVVLGYLEYKRVFNVTPPILLIGIPGALLVIGIGALVAGYFTLPYGEADIVFRKDSTSSGFVKLNGSNESQNGERDYNYNYNNNNNNNNYSNSNNNNNNINVYGSGNGRSQSRNNGGDGLVGGGSGNGRSQVTRNQGGDGGIGSGNGRSQAARNHGDDAGVGRVGSGNGRSQSRPGGGGEYNYTASTKRGMDYNNPSTPARGVGVVGGDYNPASAPARGGDYNSASAPARGRDHTGASTTGRSVERPQPSVNARGAPSSNGRDYPGGLARGPSQ
ncbi:hypothetical protein HK100_005254, partial [Physocladia obscura]